MLCPNMANTLYLNPTPPNSNPNYNNPPKACPYLPQIRYTGGLKLLLSGTTGRALCSRFISRARRRIRYEDDDDSNDDEDWGYNEDIAKLEMYSQSTREEALFVTALVDDQQVQVLIFKGFSSCLSYKTAADPTKSIVPKRARIKLIDRIKAPFNPANTEYIEKGVTWEAFQTRLRLTK